MQAAAGATSAVDGFIDKWRARWPEWRIAEAFVPASQRRTLAAWLALLQEFAEAAWGGEDRAPGLAKLAWWQEELQGWGRGARRHPLGEVLQKRPAPWPLLARALATLPATRGQAGSEALTGLAALGDALAACERALFAAADAQREATAEGRIQALALLAERTLLLGAGEDARWLLNDWPAASALRLRRLQQALLRLRLRRLAAGRTSLAAGSGRVLWTAWRAARPQAGRRG